MTFKPGSFIEAELWPIEVLHCGNTRFRRFCSCDLDRDPMTFIYELHPYSSEIYRKNEIPIRQVTVCEVRMRAFSNAWSLLVMFYECS